MIPPLDADSPLAPELDAGPLDRLRDDRALLPRS